MKLVDQAGEVVARASKMLTRHDQPTVDEALELVMRLAEIVVVLAVRHEDAGRHEPLTPELYPPTGEIEL